jgi:hypothetical protein
MADIKQKLDRIVSDTLSKNIIPVKTTEGILVGNILIVSEGSVKHIKRNDVLLYENISLNVVAVKIANLMVKYKSSLTADRLYNLDQDYSKWFIDSQFLLQRYYSAKKIKDFDKADMLWARYCESRDRAILAKDSATALSHI